MIHAVQRIREIDKQVGMVRALVDVDGRVHLDYRPLGAHSGRITSRWPNVCGLGKVFRPFIVPDPGRGIGEVDWAQIEVGIAAAFYRDDALIAMFNTGDVYVEMARRFFAVDLPTSAADLTHVEFKKKYGSFRDRMKIPSLGVIFGLTLHGMAIQLGISAAKAKAFLDKFLAMFPALALAETRQYAALRGSVTNVSGLRRYRVGTGVPSSWERNWMNNYGV